MGVPKYFVSVSYHLGADGGLAPELPDYGPCNRESDGSCRIALSHWRKRSTGPRHPLAVVCCQTHGVCFTLYPPGHVPYGRIPLVELARDGVPIDKGRDPPFRHTYFDAALDAAAGIAWPQSSLEGSLQPRFLTQTRHLHRCSLLLGLSGTASSKDREKVAEQLDIGGLILQQARSKLLAGGFRASGQAICQVLMVLSESEPTSQRLATCGHYASIWPRNQRWMASGYRRSGPGN